MTNRPEMVFRRRRLPHQDVEGHPIFITGCLEGSIQVAGWKAISEYRDELARRATPNLEMPDPDWEMLKHKLLFKFVDRLLDGNTPVHHLSDPKQAEIVQDSFLHFAGERYQLLAFVVMPSHHHWLFLPDPTWVGGCSRGKCSSRFQKRPDSPRDHLARNPKLHGYDVQPRARGVRTVLATRDV